MHVKLERNMVSKSLTNKYANMHDQMENKQTNLISFNWTILY